MPDSPNHARPTDNESTARPEPAGCVARVFNPLFWRPYLVLFWAGMIGVVSLLPTLGPVAETIAARAEGPEVPEFAWRVLLLVNPTLLLAIAVGIGTMLAPRVGFRSYLAEWSIGGGSPLPRVRSDAALAVLVGALTAVAILVLDIAFQPYVGQPAAAGEEPARTVAATISGMLYGGITEELLMRWGFMSLVAWALWRAFQGGRGEPRRQLVWGAIVVAAIVFGTGHLGIISAQTELSGPIVARTVLLNAAGGVAFGWLFWRRSLEAAMLAHATGHVIFTAAAWSGLA